MAHYMVNKSNCKVKICNGKEALTSYLANTKPASCAAGFVFCFQIVCGRINT